MQSSFLKQLIYGIFYLAIIFGVFYLAYVAIRPVASCFDGRQNQGEEGKDCGGPCESCEIRTLKPIQTVKTSIFDSGNERLSLLTELRNPNLNFGASSFSYKLDFYGSGGTFVTSMKKSSFIYPGEIKHIAEVGLDINPAQIKRVEVEITNASWKPVTEFSAPRTQARGLTLDTQDEKRLVVSGVISNDNSFALRRIVIVAVLSDQFRLPALVSRTLLENVQAFEEKSFSIVIPNERMIDVAHDSVRIFLEASE